MAGVAGLLFLVMAIYSSSMVYDEYNEAVHGGSNRSRNSNASAAICFRMAKDKASKARDTLIAGITLNTVLILFIVLVSWRCIEILNCIFFCCKTDDCISDRCRRVCNWLAVVLIAGGLVVAALALHAVDKSCKRLSAALGLLIGSLTAFAVAIFAARISCPKPDGLQAPILEEDDE